jgi:hypothetical protein
MEKIIIGAIDCYRHDFWKVPIDLLVELNIIEEITSYSYLGNSDSPLNEKGFAYLEIDTDCSTFDKAMKYYNKEFQIDFETLQEAYDEEYEDYHDWLENLDEFSTDLLLEEYDWVEASDDLKNALYEADDEEFEDEDEE